MSRWYDLQLVKGWLKNLFSTSEIEGFIPSLASADVMRCLEKAAADPVLGHHFRNIERDRMSQIADRICSLLDYAFKNDRIYPFIGLFKCHSTMNLNQEEVDAFFALLVSECFRRKGKGGLMPIQQRVLNRIKTLILHGSLKAISQNDIIEFRRNLQHNDILKERFRTITLNQVEKIMLQFIEILKPTVKDELIEEVLDKHRNHWITGEEYDEFTKLFLRLYEDRDFLVEAAPILHKMREGIVVCEPNYEFLIYNEFMKSNIFIKRFSEVEPDKVRAKVSNIVKWVSEYPRSGEDMKTIAIPHVAFKLTEQEIRELEDVFALEHLKKYVYRAKLRAFFDEFIEVLRENNGLYENEDCFYF